MYEESSNIKYKHELRVKSRFNKRIRKLDKSIKEVLMRRLRDIANNPEKAGEQLKPPYKNKYSVRVTKKFRLIYSIPQYCQVELENIQHRETVYKNYRLLSILCVLKIDYIG